MTMVAAVSTPSPHTSQDEGTYVTLETNSFRYRSLAALERSCSFQAKETAIRIRCASYHLSRSTPAFCVLQNFESRCYDLVSRECNGFRGAQTHKSSEGAIGLECEQLPVEFGVRG